MARRTRTLEVIGWREWVLLPDVVGEPLKVKIDTGARTSALHAFRLVVGTAESGVEQVSFEVHPRQRTTAGAARVTLPVAGWKEVRSSSGELQRRPVVRTPVALAGEVWPIDVTLTNRDEMGFRMLLGRAALRRRFLVDPSRSFLSVDPPAPARG